MSQIITHRAIRFCNPDPHEEDPILPPGRHTAEIDESGVARIPYEDGNTLCLRHYEYDLVPALEILAECAE